MDNYYTHVLRRPTERLTKRTEMFWLFLNLIKHVYFMTPNHIRCLVVQYPRVMRIILGDNYNYNYAWPLLIIDCVNFIECPCYSIMQCLLCGLSIDSLRELVIYFPGQRNDFENVQLHPPTLSSRLNKDLLTRDSVLFSLTIIANKTIYFSIQ